MHGRPRSLLLRYVKLNMNFFVIIDQRNTTTKLPPTVLTTIITLGPGKGGIQEAVEGKKWRGSTSTAACRITTTTIMKMMRTAASVHLVLVRTLDSSLWPHPCPFNLGFSCTIDHSCKGERYRRRATTAKGGTGRVRKWQSKVQCGRLVMAYLIFRAQMFL